MEKKKTIYTALAVLLTLTSCGQEDPAGNSFADDGNRIYFRTSLPSVTESRAGIVDRDNLSECRVTAINPYDDRLIDSQSNEIAPYFSDLRFSKQDDGNFVADDALSTIWPNSRDRLHFFAYHPSADAMRQVTGGVEDDFSLVNYSKMSGGTPSLDYRLEGFTVAPDIADQVDFIAAYTAATQQDNKSGAIHLNFSHQLSRIELSAWGASEKKYDFEIAGVRIGNALTGGHFNFTSLMSDAAAWSGTDGNQAPVEHVFGAGETIVVLNQDNHTSSGEAASIMGAGGPAMVIPMTSKIEAWEGKADPNIDDAHYSTDKLYFSVLLRVINRDGDIVYPYPNDADSIPVTYLVVGDDGRVVRQVYRFDDEYYTAPVEAATNRYVPADSEEIRGFCWAALPVTGGAKWDAGKIYTYKLNYTNGIGWQDPDDPLPGEPIIERGKIPFEVDVEDWVEAEGHNPDIEVPKR